MLGLVIFGQYRSDMSNQLEAAQIVTNKSQGVTWNGWVFLSAKVTILVLF